MNGKKDRMKMGKDEEEIILQNGNNKMILTRWP